LVRFVLVSTNFNYRLLAMSFLNGRSGRHLYVYGKSPDLVRVAKFFYPTDLIPFLFPSPCKLDRLVDLTQRAKLPVLFASRRSTERFDNPGG